MHTCEIVAARLTHSRTADWSLDLCPSLTTATNARWCASKLGAVQRKTSRLFSFNPIQSFHSCISPRRAAVVCRQRWLIAVCMVAFEFTQSCFSWPLSETCAHCRHHEQALSVLVNGHWSSISVGVGLGQSCMRKE